MARKRRKTSSQEALTPIPIELPGADKKITGKVSDIQAQLGLNSIYDLAKSSSTIIGTPPENKLNLPIL